MFLCYCFFFIKALWLVEKKSVMFLIIGQKFYFSLNAKTEILFLNRIYGSTAELGFFAILRNLIKYTRYMLGGQYFISLFALKKLRNILLKRKFVYLCSNKFTSSINKTIFFSIFLYQILSSWFFDKPTTYRQTVKKMKMMSVKDNLYWKFSFNFENWKAIKKQIDQNV